MMNSIKRLSVSVLASMMLMGTAHAKEVDLKKFEDKFNMMWNQTQASTNRVNGAYGGTLGGVSMRSPIRNWKMMSLTPPRFEAGCGGIDLQIDWQSLECLFSPFSDYLHIFLITI